MSSRRHKRLQCSHDGCGSRRITTGDDGFRYCDQGHQQSELGTVVAEDTGELPNHGKTSRRRDLDASSFTSRASGFSGTRAFEHYLLCMQVVMRKQLQWLIDVQRLPTELETVVRDLWALRLQKVQGRATYDSETDTEAQRSEMFSSQSEGESGTDAATLNSQRSRQASRRKSRGPSLLDLVCLEYIGAMLLKIPLTVSDLHNWISHGELLYYRAAKEVSLSMRIHLPGYLQEQFEPQSIIAPDAIHRNVSNLLLSMQTDMGMTPPPLNHSLVLYRWIQELSLPLEVYVGTQRLATLLDLDYCYSLDAKAGTNQSLRYPEVRLMAVVIITTKLLFPFDDSRRYPKAPNDMAMLKMDWTSWADMQKVEALLADEQPVKKGLSYENAFSMTEADSIALSDDSLDQYLDWCENNIASEDIRDRGKAAKEAEYRRALFEWFPSTARPGASRPRSAILDAVPSVQQRAVHSQENLRLGRIVQEDGSDDIPRVGMSHAQYRTRDELHGTSKLFYQRASRVAGYSVHGMVRAAFLLERQMLQHEKLQRKSRKT
ncbi:uncharacterized protein RCC_05688 [Ramularia collo-cygni]|uniref:RRN7-type domain-containing protein n=1 Tax=Ramularia collo-cygni TaxID=112498 RepID=A0A2D3URN3_9PEZI|nr:uncharacterized protein RCC_05688 [Ramularia collo-cygni]CZT19832.1 uncharacterized protein RCC_05688 [Ramularia collo-cygni]